MFNLFVAMAIEIIKIVLHKASHNITHLNQRI